MNLQGTGTLVTGASRGLGKALSIELARRGARVVMVARNHEELQWAVEEVRSLGGEAHALQADVGDKQAIYPLVGASAALVGPIDLLIHNASTLGKLPMPLLLDTDCEDLEQVLQVNLVGPFRLSKAVAGSMVLRRTGLIVHISSDAAVSAYPRWGSYSVSKAAQDHLSSILAAELADTGVRLLSIDPGEMNTRMHADAMPDADPATLADPAEVARRIVRIIEDGRNPSGARLQAQEESS